MYLGSAVESRALLKVDGLNSSIVWCSTWSDRPLLALQTSHCWKCSSMNRSPVQLDPLDSPYPIPWNWVLATQTEISHIHTPRLRYYRTQGLVSPDGEYVAYSRLQMQVEPENYRSWVSSVMFVENLHTGNLQTIAATAPLADNPFAQETLSDRTGTISILIPVAWSEEGDRLLGREFESTFGSDMASDFAVLWERTSHQSHTVSPRGINFTHAILLGWSRTYPDRALFRAGILGEAEWPCWTVDGKGYTEPASEEDQPLSFGNTSNSVWMGPQAS